MLRDLDLEDHCPAALEFFSGRYARDGSGTPIRCATSASEQIVKAARFAHRWARIDEISRRADGLCLLNHPFCWVSGFAVPFWPDDHHLIVPHSEYFARCVFGNRRTRR